MSVICARKLVVMIPGNVKEGSFPAKFSGSCTHVSLQVFDSVFGIIIKYSIHCDIYFIGPRLWSYDD